MFAIKEQSTGKWVSKLSPLILITYNPIHDQVFVERETEAELVDIVDALNAPEAGRFTIGSHPRH